MKVCFSQWKFAVLAVCFVLTGTSTVFAGPARFWISTSTVSAGPEAPSIDLLVGATQRIYIWGQPATDGSGFKVLQSLSLNLVTEAPDVANFDILDNFQVNNPFNGTTNPPKQRFEPQFVRDSDSPDANTRIYSTATASQVLGQQSDSIIELSNVPGTGPLSAGIAQTSLFAGIGGPQDPGDNMLLGNSRAWLVATVDLVGIRGSAPSRLHLQVGSLGMNHVGELSVDTSVIFGLPTDPEYNARDNRQITFPNTDTPDLLVTGIARGDFDRDGQVTELDISAMLKALTNLTDYRATHDNLSLGRLLLIGDLNSDNKVTNADIQGLLNLLASGAGAHTVPEPSTSLLAVLACCLFTINRLTRCRAK